MVFHEFVSPKTFCRLLQSCQILHTLLAGLLTWVKLCITANIEAQTHSKASAHLTVTSIFMISHLQSQQTLVTSLSHYHCHSSPWWPGWPARCMSHSACVLPPCYLMSILLAIHMVFCYHVASKVHTINRGGQPMALNASGMLPRAGGFRADSDAAMGSMILLLWDSPVLWDKGLACHWLQLDWSGGHPLLASPHTLESSSWPSYS